MLSGLALLLGGAVFMVARSLMQPPATAGAQGTGASAPVVSGQDLAGALAAAEQLSQSGPDGAAQAIVVLDRAITVYPDSQDLRLALAKARMVRQEWGLALAAFREAIRIGPATAPLLFQAGTVADDAGDLDAAAELFTRARFTDPREPAYAFNLAMVQIKQGQDTAARTSLLGVIKLDKDNAKAWGTLAQLELKTNELGLAEQHIAEARSREPDVVRWRVTQARILNRQNKAQDALDLLIGLAPADRLSEGALQTMAESLGLLRQPARAAALYEQALAIRAGDGELAYQAAMWHERAGNAEAARDYLTRAASMGHAGAKKALEGA